jgi:uncharacterized membrane protein YgdD (TMEM256/DUF423 family)
MEKQVCPIQTRVPEQWLVLLFPRMQKFLLGACAINGFLAVALGAFGAHGLKSYLAPLSDAARRLEWWETASHYHLFHALALGVLASWAGSGDDRALRLAGGAMLAGIVLFSGSLYAMTLTGQTRLGIVTPFGGLALLVGWGSLLVSVLRR